MKTVKIETNRWQDVQAGDRIAVVREDCEYLGLRVEENRSQLFISEKSFGRPHSTRRTYFNQIPKDWELISIVREVTPKTAEPKMRWKFSEIFKKSTDSRPAVGSQEAIQEAIDSTDSIVDYFDTRVQMGDPLFDQWMVDAHEAAIASSDNLRKLLKVMKGEE